MQVVVLGSQITMTSLELVDFINSQRGEGESELRHDHFMAKVPQVLGETGAPNFRGTYRDVQNKERPCYTFPKREACLMAMSYSYDLQAKVFDRMTTLEAQAAKPIDPMAVLSDPAAMRGLLLTYTEKVLALQATVEAQAPKVEALDRLASADGMLNLQTAGKTLQQPPNKFIQWLRENNWIYKRAGSTQNCARAEKFNAGYLTTNACTITQPDGTELVREQVMVTPKGLTKLATLLALN